MPKACGDDSLWGSKTSSIVPTVGNTHPTKYELYETASSFLREISVFYFWIRLSCDATTAGFFVNKRLCDHQPIKSQSCTVQPTRHGYDTVARITGLYIHIHIWSMLFSYVNNQVIPRCRMHKNTKYRQKRWISTSKIRARRSMFYGSPSCISCRERVREIIP